MTRPIARRLAAVTVAMVLVVAAIGGGLAPDPVQPAEAAELFPDCTWFASTYMGFSQMVFNTVTQDDTGCRVFDLDTSQDSTARADIFAGAKTLTEAQDTALATMDNRLTDARAPAYTEAKIAMINEINAGGNESEVRQAAHDAVDEFYSPMVVNLNALWVQKLAYLNYSWKAYFQSGSDPWFENDRTVVDGPNGSQAPAFHERTLTLPNGETIPTTVLHGTDLSGTLVDVHWSDNASLSGDLPTKVGSGSANHVSIMMYPDPYAQHVFMEAPTTDTETWNYDTALGIDPPPEVTGVNESSDKIHYYHTRIYDEIAQVKANIDPLVNDTVANYSEGDLDTSEILSPVELASRASTDYNSTGYYSFHAAQLAMMGYAGNITHAHVVDYNNNLYNGTLFYTGDDLTELETGVTYEPANFTGDFVMAYQVDANTSDVLDLNGNFTIVEQTDTQTGQVVTATSMEAYTYNTTNSTDLAEDLERLADAREEMVEQGLILNVGGGGFLDGIASFFGNLLSGTSLGLVLVGVAVVVFLLGKES